KHSGASARAANAGAWGHRDFRGGQKGWWTTPQLVATMPVSPAGSHKQQNFGLSTYWYSKAK
ncbi:LOW QUALITY PROTEIN: WDR78 isoform 8, partial [Pongo abelii]